MDSLENLMTLAAGPAPENPEMRFHVGLLFFWLKDSQDAPAQLRQVRGRRPHGSALRAGRPGVRAPARQRRQCTPPREAARHRGQSRGADPALPGWGAVHPPAGQHRRLHPRLGDPLRLGDDVGVEHHQIGRVAGQEQAAAAVARRRHRRRRAVNPSDRVGHGDSLGRDTTARARRRCDGRLRGCRPADRAAPPGASEPNTRWAPASSRSRVRYADAARSPHSGRPRRGRTSRGWAAPRRSRRARQSAAGRRRRRTGHARCAARRVAPAPTPRGSPRGRRAPRAWRRRRSRARPRRGPPAAASRTISSSSAGVTSASPGAVEHPGRPRAERAVHEHLHRPDPQQLAAEPGAQLERASPRRACSTGTAMCTRRVRRRSASSRCHRPRPPGRWRSWTPTTPRALASATLARTARETSSGSGVGQRERAGVALVQDAGRVRDAGRRKRRRVQPQRVPVVRHSAAGRSPVTASRSAAVAGAVRPRTRLASRGRAASRSPSASRDPRAAPRPSSRTRAGRARVRASAHSWKCTWASEKPGQDAAAVEIDRARGPTAVVIALAYVHAARDQRRRRATAPARAGAADPWCRSARFRRIMRRLP